MLIVVRDQKFNLKKVQAGDYTLFDMDDNRIGQVWEFGPRQWRHSKLGLYHAASKTMKSSIDELVYFHQQGMTGFA